MRGVLGRRAFRRVWVGESLSMLGDAAFVVAFVALVLEVTGSAGTLAALLVAGAVPRGVLLLVGGAVVDRVSARTVLVGAHAMRGVAIGVLAALAATDAAGLPALAAVTVLVGAADAFAGPAGAALLPTLVERAQLPRANALVASSEQVALATAPIAAGLAVAAAGPAVALAADAATFAVATLTVLAAPRRRPTPASAAGSTAAAPEAAPQPAPGGAGLGIRAGLTAALRAPDVRAVLVVVSAATLSYAGVFAVGLPALAAVRAPEDPSVALGLLLSAWGVGQLVGSVGAGITGLPARWGLLIAGMAVAEAATFVAVGLVPAVAVAAILLALLGVGAAYSQDVALPTWLQTRTPPEELGRTSSILELPRTVLAPVSVAATGVLVAVDVRLAFAAAAVPVLAAGLWLLSRPATRRLSAGGRG